MTTKAGTGIALAVSFLMMGFAAHGQQTPSGGASPGPAAGGDKCAEFGGLLSGVDGVTGSSGPDRVEKRFGRLEDAAKAGRACAESITETFRKLRGQDGAEQPWSEIERQLDRVIAAQQGLIEKIEGTGGLIEEAKRSESVLQQRIEEAARKYPEEVEKEKARLQRLKAISDQTSQRKDGLARAIRSMQAAKPRIAFTEGGRRFDAAIEVLDQFNKYLDDFTAKLPPLPGAPGT